jgi:hypothetical protein
MNNEANDHVCNDIMKNRYKSRQLADSRNYVQAEMNKSLIESFDTVIVNVQISTETSIMTLIDVA